MADGGGPGTVDWLTHASRIPLRLTLADGSTYPHPGRIIFADRQVNTQTGTIQIVGEFPNSKNLLRPGQYARVQAPTGNIEGALLVPQAAVNQQQGANQITVVGADNRAQLRTVQVGPSTSNICVRCHERLGDSCRTVRPFLSQFRRWAAGAEVLEGGDAPGRGSGRDKTLDKV